MKRNPSLRRLLQAISVNTNLRILVIKKSGGSLRSLFARRLANKAARSFYNKKVDKT